MRVAKFLTSQFSIETSESSIESEQHTNFQASLEIKNSTNQLFNGPTAKAEPGFGRNFNRINSILEEDHSEHDVHSILFPKESLQATLALEK